MQMITSGVAPRPWAIFSPMAIAMTLRQTVEKPAQIAAERLETEYAEQAELQRRKAEAQIAGFKADAERALQARDSHVTVAGRENGLRE